MFSSGVPEKVIAEVTGYKSTTALRQYERTSKEQKQAAGKAIAQAPMDSKASINSKTSIEQLKEDSKNSSRESYAYCFRNIIWLCV